MTNDPSNHDIPVAESDPELEQLLTDAYDAPPVPRSLLKRIDRSVAAEWGESPKLVQSRAARLQRAAAAGSRWVTSLPLAAGAAIMVLLGVMFSGNSPTYAWAEVLKAMEQHGVVQIDGPNGTRWLSLADGVLSEQTADSSRLVDLGNRIVLERDAGAAQVRRRKFPSTSPGADRDEFVLGFLLGGRRIAGTDSSPLTGVRVVDESWESITVGGVEQIALSVEFASGSAERIELTMLLDPETRLPIACQTHDGSTATTSSQPMSYPQTTLADFREQQFPAELAVVDVGDSIDSSVAVAEADSTTPEPAVEPQQEVKTASNDPVIDEPKPDIAVEQPPLFGAAAQWKAVAPVEATGGDVVQQINALLTALWKEHNVTPTDAAGDEELLRRVYLDLAGRTPGVNEVRTYLGDESPDRYEILVDRLLKSPDHASHLATVWRTFLLPEGVDLAPFGGVQAFDKWLAERFASDDSYDEVVRSLLLAEGRLSRSGPLLFYSAAKLDPHQLASRTSRVFLGMRLECAQCHDHPFEPWSQEDFWSFAAFFAQISRPQGELENVSTVMRVRDVDRGEVMLPETEIVVAPKYLDGSEFNSDEQNPARRQQLARWLTGADNPYFARATANRVWGQLFGRGIVDPVDDFGTQHTPKSPELIDLLAGHLINTGFSLRELFRTVALSDAYRLSSGADTVDENRTEWFAQMNIKTLTAEQVYDCITVATLLDSSSSPDPYSLNVERFGNTEREVFLQQFRTPSGRMTEYLGGIPQALTLMNGTLIEGATGLSSSGLLKSLEAPFFTNRQRIEVLYFATLSRRPTAAEWELLRNYIAEDAGGTELQEGLADVLWALLNSAEFTLNH